MVAEFAITVPVAIGLVVFGASLGDAGVRRAQAQDAAAALARVAARGEPLAPVASTLSARIPGMKWTANQGGEVQCIEVTSRRAGALAVLFPVSASACSLAPAT